MKRTVKYFACIFIVLLLCTTLCSSCDFIKKVGVALNFQKKVEKSTSLSFDMTISIKRGDEESRLDISCYKNGEEYAYTFAEPGNENMKYRRLFADDCLYEYLNTSFYVGSYYTNENVPVDDERNLLYSVIKKIMLTTFATIVSDGEKDTVRGSDATRYDVSLDGNEYSLWYDENNLVKVAAVVNTQDEGENVVKEEFEAEFWNYDFECKETAPFLRPGDKYDAFYVESPIPFEDWMGIISEFTELMSVWM